VHAPSGGGEVEISNLHSSYWQKRFNGARRVNF
jgi:cell wall-associated NlpC family hydrolase